MFLSMMFDHQHQLTMRSLPAFGAAKPRRPPWSAYVLGTGSWVGVRATTVSQSQSRMWDRLVACMKDGRLQHVASLADKAR